MWCIDIAFAYFKWAFAMWRIGIPLLLISLMLRVNFFMSRKNKKKLNFVIYTVFINTKCLKAQLILNLSLILLHKQKLNVCSIPIALQFFYLFAFQVQWFCYIVYIIESYTFHEGSDKDRPRQHGDTHPSKAFSPVKAKEISKPFQRKNIYFWWSSPPRILD